MQKNNKLTKKYSYFKPENFEISDLKKNERAKGQKIAYIKYKNNGKVSLIFMQTPSIKMRSFGIPRENEEFYPTPYSRSFVKIPLNNNEEPAEDGKVASKEEIDFYNTLKEWDEYFGSDEFKTQLFEKKDRSKYMYQPIIRESEESESKDGKKYYRPDYMKAKLMVDFDTKNITTNIFKRNENGEGPKREKVDTDMLEDVEKYIKFGNDVKYVLTPSKIWAGTNPTKRYGIGFKVSHAEVTMSNIENNKEYMEGDAFLDSDDEEPEEMHEDETDDNESDDDQESGSDLSDSDDEKIVKKSKKASV